MPKTSDVRLHWRLHNSWPACDRSLWLAGTCRAHPLDIPKYGQALSLASLDTIERAYGRFVNWLDNQGLLGTEDHPKLRPTPSRVARYLHDLGDLGYSGQSRLLLLSGLRSAMRILVPDEDWGWIVRPAGVSVLSRLRNSSQQPPITLPESSQLYRWGLSIIRAAENGPAGKIGSRAYRDGLMIAFLAARPVRVRTLTGMVLKQHLIRTSGGWLLVLEPKDMKNKRALEQPLPKSLSDPFDRYVSCVRNQLGASDDQNAVWIGNDGLPMKKDAIGRMIALRASADLRMHFTPHRFRHAAATSAMIEDTETPGLAASLLAIGTTMIRKHYDRSDELLAIKRFHDGLSTERRRLERLARHAFDAVERDPDWRESIQAKNH